MLNIWKRKMLGHSSSLKVYICFNDVITNALVNMFT